MTTPHQIYEALEARRLELGLSQAEVGARAFGKSDNAAFQALRRGSSPSAEKLAGLCAAVGWEFYFGPPRSTGPSEQTIVDGADFAQIPVHKADLAAGEGADNTTEDFVGHLAFRRSWLKRIGVTAASAVLARAHGDSMLPLIHAGDMVLIDRARRNIPVRRRTTKDARLAPIYAIDDDGMARLKRVERPEPGIAILGSDNPSFPAEVLTGKKVEGLHIIGKVMWWGHTNIE